MPQENSDSNQKLSKAQLHAPTLTSARNANGPTYVLHGDWTIETIAELELLTSGQFPQGQKATCINVSGLSSLDTSGAWAITRLIRQNNLSVHDVAGLSDDHRTLLDAVAETNKTHPSPEREQGTCLSILDHVGRNVVEVLHDMALLAHLMGGLLKGLGTSLLDPRKLRITSVIHHIDQTGLKAVPIVALMSFLVGAIVAQQGAFQLRKFGAEPFVIDLVGILVLREVGILLTAILVAGRSGSAFTAEIGSMKMREEIDALKVMGLSTIQVLITPRVLALVIALPLLGMVSNISALFGGGMLLWVYSDIAPHAYIAWLREAVALNTFFVGLIKAPFMALIVSLISCAEGLQVGGSAESLGRHTTAAVVKSIFLVVLVDGIFAIFFAAIGY